MRRSPGLAWLNAGLTCQRRSASIVLDAGLRCSAILVLDAGLRCNTPLVLGSVLRRDTPLELGTGFKHYAPLELLTLLRRGSWEPCVYRLRRSWMCQDTSLLRLASLVYRMGLLRLATA